MERATTKSILLKVKGQSILLSKRGSWAAEMRMIGKMDKGHYKAGEELK